MTLLLVLMSTYSQEVERVLAQNSEDVRRLSYTALLAWTDLDPEQMGRRLKQEVPPEVHYVVSDTTTGHVNCYLPDDLFDWTVTYWKRVLGGRRRRGRRG